MTSIHVPSPICHLPSALAELDNLREGRIARIWASLRQHGAVLLSQAARDHREFVTLTKLFATNFRVHHSPKRLWYTADGTTQSVNVGRAAIELHAERAYLPERPELLFLYCVSPPSIGGDTTICDGAAVLEGLDSKLRRECEAARVVWHTTISKDSWIRSWASRSEVHRWFEDRNAKRSDGRTVKHWFDNETLCVDYECPLIDHGWIGRRRVFANYLLVREPFGPWATLANGDPVPETWLTALHEAANRIIAHVAWRAADVLMIDNTRCLHGRRAVGAGERVIMARMGDVKPELRGAQSKP